MAALQAEAELSANVQKWLDYHGDQPDAEPVPIGLPCTSNDLTGDEWQ